MSALGDRFRDAAARVRETNGAVCSKCATPLRENVSGSRCIGDARVCSDCYFAKLSDLIEETGVGRPVTR